MDTACTENERERERMPDIKKIGESYDIAADRNAIQFCV